MLQWGMHHSPNLSGFVNGAAKRMRPIWIAGPAALAAVSVAAAAPAPPSATALASDGGSGWRVECANDGTRLDCRTINRVHQRDNQQLIAAVAVRIVPETKKPVLAVQVPLGIQVGEAVLLKVDEGKVERYPVQTCTPSGCVVGAALSDAQLASLRGGKELKVAFQNMSKQTITVTMPLAGFGMAYDKIK
jgi:invasion protein IalB